MSGQSDDGYTQKSNFTPQMEELLKSIIGQSSGNTAAASQGFKDFLPGGKGNQPIVDAANKNYQQQTIPSIMNSFGVGNKGSSALNQALASSASNLNSNLGATLAQNQLTAAQGLGQMGTQQQSLGINAQPFSHLQQGNAFWQDLVLALAGATGEGVKGWATGGFKGL